MRIDEATWLEVEAYLKVSPGIIIPTGSTEQHGPMGMIGTDTICAQKISEAAGEIANAYVAPTFAYTPAHFNTAFAGTMSISRDLFEALLEEVTNGLTRQNFSHIYILNGHGANLKSLKRIKKDFKMIEAKNGGSVKIRIRNWWDFDAVNLLRQTYYGDWEGMHATPSEISITQATNKIIAQGIAKDPPEKLSAQFIKDHAGDRHGSPKKHRNNFPDGRVGSHSALAKPEHGRKLLQAAAEAVAQDYLKFVKAAPSEPNMSLSGL